MPGQSGLQYYFTNGHGDVTEIRDAQGNLLNRYTYDIWGNPLTEEEQVPNMFRYSGEYWDKTTNLQYLRARWYDPSIGRFITEDTYEGELTNPLSLNQYTYVENNPLTKIDPTGNSAWKLCAGSLLCFSAGTKVKTEQGLKPIEEIQVGDQVQTRNEETGELGYHPVEELFQRETDETYHVKVNGTTIITTAEHPFWVAGEGWVEARDLKKGDKLVDLDDQEVPIEDIDVKKERITVYNFRVQGIHNYFVTDLKIWTHNCGGRDGALSGGRMSSSISAPRVGGGGGYSRPANVSRGPAGAKIEIPKNAEQFYKSVLDKGLQSNKGTGNALIKDTGNLAKNTGNLRSWAKNNGWEQKYTDGGVEMWGVKNADGTFSWRLKLKPEVSTRDGLGVGSNQPRFDARLNDKGTYINPFTGQTGGRDVGTHIPLGK